MTSRPYKRRRKLVKPKIQLKLVGAFVGVSVLGFLLQYILLAKELTELALSMPEGGAVLAAKAPTLLLSVLAISFGLLFPLTVAVGIVLTFRIVGPIYRFEQYLGAVARGEETGPCRIRRNDELHELCDTINMAVRSLQASAPHLPEAATEEVRSGDPEVRLSA